MSYSTKGLLLFLVNLVSIFLIVILEPSNDFVDSYSKKCSVLLYIFSLLYFIVGIKAIKKEKTYLLGGAMIILGILNILVTAIATNTY